MPLYDWVDKKTNKEALIQRVFDDYKVPPNKEEALEAGLTEAEIADADWERNIGGGIQVTRGPSWTGSKGNW